MKSELKETEQQPVPMFPALYKASCGGVILFSDETTGVVVKQSREQILGEFCDAYIACTNTRHWTRLPSGSQVVLTQE